MTSYLSRATTAMRGAALLALALPLAAMGTAHAQTAEDKKRQATSEAIAASHGTLLDELSVYADRNSRQVLSLPQNVTVIGRKELDERGVRDVQDLVRYEPGITVAKTTSSTDPFGNLAGFTIRGVSNNRVQMIVDGTRVIEGIVDGNRDFVNMTNLKAVEFIRGPAGVMWGADALGGIVAFVTKDPEDYLKGRKFGGQLDTNYDSYDKSFFKTGTSAVRFGDFSAMVSVSQRTYNEGTLSKARADGGIYGCPRPAEAIRCNQLNPLSGEDIELLGKLVWTPDNEHEFKFTTEYLNKDATVDQRLDLGLQTGGITNLSYIRNQQQTRERYTLAHKYTPNLGWIDRIKWQATFSPQEQDKTGIRMRRLANGQQDRLDYLLNYKEQFTEGDIQLNSSFKTFWATHALTYGAYASLAETDYVRRDTTTNLTTNAVTVANAGGFNFANATTTRIDGYIQDEISLLNDRWIVTPGVRYATYELDPRTNQYYVVRPGNAPPGVSQSEKLVKQFGSLFKLDQNFALVGRYAEGFKMPTSQQLYTSLPNGGGSNSDLIPNANLRPESVKSYEIGLRGQSNQGYFSATVFRADYTDFIQSFVEVPSVNFPGIFDYTYQNLSKLNLWGVEFASEYRFNDYWTANFSVAYTEGTQQINATSAQTAYDGTTPFSGVMGVRYHDRPNGFDAMLISTWSAGTLTRSTPSLYRASEYVVFDAIVNYSPQIAPGLTLRGSLLNIADTRYMPSLTGTTTYSNTATAAVAMANPIELRTAPGRTFKVGASYAF